MKILKKSYNNRANEIIIKFNDNRFSSESIHFSFIDTAHNIGISSDKIKFNYWFTICILPVVYLIDKIDEYESTDFRSIYTYFKKIINKLPSLIYSPINMNSWKALNEINNFINEFNFTSLFMKKAYGAIVYAYSKAIRERLSRIEFVCNIHADNPNTIFTLSTLEVINDYKVYELISYSGEEDDISLSDFKFYNIFESKTIVNKFIMPLDGAYFDKDLLDRYFTRLHILDSAYVEDTNSIVAHFDSSDPDFVDKFNQYQTKFINEYLKLMYTKLVYEDDFKPMLQYYGFTIE